MRIPCSILLVILVWTGSIAGTIGKWKSYTSKREIRSVVVVDSVIWTATSGGAFSYDLRNGSIRQFTTSEGLRAIDLTSITSDENGHLWFGASNGVVQRYSPLTGVWDYVSGIFTAPDEPQKQINSLNTWHDTLFISSEMGVSVFSISRMEFGDTYRRFGSTPGQITGRAVDVELFQDKLWVATASGIAMTPADNLNPSAPGSWQIINTGLPSTLLNELAVYHDTLFAATSMGLAYFTGSGWQTVSQTSGKNIASLSASFTPSSGELFFSTGNQIWSYGTGAPVLVASGFSSELTELASDGVAGTLSAGVVINPSITVEPSGVNWRVVVPDGPHTNRFSGLAVDGEGIFWSGTGTSGGEGFMSFDGTTWKRFLPETLPQLNGVRYTYIVDIGPGNSKWISTFGEGAVQLNAVNDVERIFNTTNGLSFTNNAQNNHTFVVVTGVVTDRYGDVWINVRGAGDRNLLAIYSPSVDSFRYASYPTGYSLPNLLNMVEDNNGTKWFTSVTLTQESTSPGLVFYDETKTLPRRLVENSGWGIITVNRDGLSNNDVTSVVVDMDGSLWVGTGEGGINIIVNPLIPYSILPYHPLSGQKVNDILVDPLNQKWVATEHGVYLLTPDGTTTVEHLTVESTNGKLLDDRVSSMAINPLNGTIYFATASGLATLSTSSVAPRTTFDELHIYPNPFLLPAGDELTIDGLVENSSIKILTTSGNLIRELSTPGGRVGTWDGKDESGEDVSSGIYIVVAYKRDGSSVGKGKVAVIKK